MTTELYLVRHGETEWNKEGKFQGSTNIDLSEAGILQAVYAKEALKNKFEVIYSSPLNRAVQTATILCEDKEFLTPIIEPDLREINFGKWEGLTFNQIKEQYPDEFKAFRTDEIHGNLVGGDLTLKNASTRASNAIKEIAAKHNGEKIAIVAHGGIIKAALIGIFDWKMTMYHKFYLGNTSISRLSFTNSQTPILVGLNDMNHLPVE